MAACASKVIKNIPWWEVALSSPPFSICIIMLALGASFLLSLRLRRALLVIFVKMDGLLVSQTVVGMEWNAGGSTVIGSATQRDDKQQLVIVRELSGLPFPGKGGDGKMMVHYLNV